MKKLLLLSVVLLGAVSISRAGVRVDLGIGLPLPPLPPHVVIGAPAPYYDYAPPVCAPAPVYAPPRVVFAPPVFHFGWSDYPRHHGHHYPRHYWRGHGHGHHGGHHGHHRGHGHRGGHHGRW